MKREKSRDFSRLYKEHLSDNPFIKFGILAGEELIIDTTFIDDLASKAPVPGGGGACAYAGALASALASMVGNLTVGKKTYAAVESETQDVLARLLVVRTQLLELVDEDARAFEPLAAAYRMPQQTPQQTEIRHQALQSALIYACEVPLEIMYRVSEVVDMADYLAHFGSKLARSDAGVAAAFARAASDGASLNIFINSASMDNKEAAAEYRDKAATLASRTRKRCDDLFDFVKADIS